MAEADWQPSADLPSIKARARLLQSLRAFFDARGYLEVETPALTRSAATDPNIESLHISDSSHGSAWLQSSPEFAMKRLLAAGSGPIFQICHAWRDGELGRWHNPEFSMLEWYVPGFDHAELMDEVEALMCWLAGDGTWPEPFKRATYRDCFLSQLGIDPFESSLHELEACALKQGISVQPDLDRDAWLDLLMGQCIGPRLGLTTPCFVLDYPASQAALSRVRDTQPPVASRFELYWRGLELANGFHELSDSVEQRRRFEADQALRKAQGKPVPPFDQRLIAALDAGLPDCAGVALGVDRLLALLENKTSLADVISFPFERV